MGFAETIPGVGAGTVAFIIGIYERFISFMSSVSGFIKKLFINFPKIFQKNGVKNIIKDFKNLDLEFAIPLFSGVLIAIAIFSNLVSFLLSNFAIQMMSIFFGIIIATTYISIKNSHFSKNFLFFSFLTFVLSFILFGISVKETSSPSFIFLFFAGMVAILAILLPSISGSFVLLILGLYEFILSRVAKIFLLNFSFEVIFSLFIFGVGMIFGLILFSKIFEDALKKFEKESYAVITGFLLASLKTLWPFLDVKSGETAEKMTKISPFDLGFFENFQIAIFSLIGFLIVFFLLKNKKTKR